MKAYGYTINFVCLLQGSVGRSKEELNTASCHKKYQKVFHDCFRYTGGWKRKELRKSYYGLEKRKYIYLHSIDCCHLKGALRTTCSEKVAVSLPHWITRKRSSYLVRLGIPAGRYWPALTQSVFLISCNRVWYYLYWRTLAAATTQNNYPCKMWREPPMHLEIHFQN